MVHNELYGRFPSGFPTQIPWTRWTLFSVRVLFLSFWCFHVLPLTLVNLASIHLICFAIKLWTDFSPCFKASSFDWKSVESCFFKSFNVKFNFFTIHCVLFDRPVQFASITGLQLVSWHGKLLSEQPSTLRKVTSFACKMSECLDRSVVNHYCSFWNEP